jgi:hypothetical protein
MDPLDFQNTDEPGHEFKTFKIKFDRRSGLMGFTSSLSLRTIPLRACSQVPGLVKVIGDGGIII